MELIAVNKLEIRNFVGTTLDKGKGRSFIVHHPDEGAFGMLMMSHDRKITPYVFEYWNGTLNAVKLMDGITVLFAKTWNLEIVEEV